MKKFTRVKALYQGFGDDGGEIHHERGSKAVLRVISVVKKPKVHHKAPQKRDKRDFRW